MSLTAWRRRPVDHECTQDDVGFVVEDTLRDNKGALVDLTGISSVRYVLWIPGAASAEVDQLGAVIAPATNGQVRYTFVAADTDTLGDFMEQWKVTFSGSAIQRFPSEPHKMTINQKVAP